MDDACRQTFRPVAAEVGEIRVDLGRETRFDLVGARA